MAFSLYESFVFNFSPESLSPRPIDSSLAESRYKEFAGKMTDSRQGTIIYPQFHILSADKVTRNRTLYTYAAHKGKNLGLESTGQYSLTQPYNIPIIEMHRSSDSIAIPASQVFGRMKDGKLVKNRETGRAHLAGLGEITHPEAVDEILTGRWLTGSLGSSVGVAYCSICRMAITSQADYENHPHKRGGFYRPAKGRESESADEMGYVQVAGADRSGNLCYTAVDEYRAQEYSKVVMPSDNESVVTNPDTQAFPGGHFNGSPSKESEEVPTTSLWVPMEESTSRGVSSWGERYLDLITGREMSAESLGLLHGLQLHEYVEQAPSLGLTESGVWLPTITPTEIHQPSITTEGSTYEEEPTDPHSVESVEEMIENVLDVSDRKTLAKKTPKAFCGPGSSFPIENRSHYTAGLRLLSRYKGPGNKSQIKACILRKGRKMGWSKENAQSMSKQAEEATPYALRVLVPLPAGEKSYDLLPRETSDERTQSLSVLETLDDLLASLEEEDETLLRSLLAESATGEEGALEVTVTAENYLVLASIIDHLTEETEEPTPTEPLTRESLKALIQESISELLPQESAETPVETLKTLIHVSEKSLGMALTTEFSESASDLQTQAEYLSAKALEVVEEAHTEVQEEVQEETVQEGLIEDTQPADLQVENPLLGEEATEDETSKAIAAKPELKDLRKSLSGLVGSNLRRDLRRR